MRPFEETRITESKKGHGAILSTNLYTKHNGIYVGGGVGAYYLILPMESWYGKIRWLVAYKSLHMYGSNVGNI